jgi:HK97 family phage major capsid protein/HK97 family phage prohead protease
MNRAYSLIEFKAMDGDDDDKRIITGIATTPTPDRMDDIVEPKGAEFKLPIPLLWQHDANQPIGHVTHAKVTAKGIEITAKLAKVTEPGKLKDRIDEAWHSIKAGLVQGLSIGFKGIETARIEGSYGLRFLKWSWLELSAVTIPANAEASILSIKSIDSELLAASGRKQGGDTPGASGRTVHLPVVKANPNHGKTEMSKIVEQIKSFEAARQTKMDRMSAIMDESAEKGETLNAEQTEEYDGLQAEVKSIDAHITRLKAHEAAQAATATPVAAVTKAADASAARQPAGYTGVKAQPKLAPGIMFARLARCKALGKLSGEGPSRVAKSLYGEQSEVYNIISKADVAAAQTGHATWAGALVGDETSAFADFVEYLRPMTIVGKFGANGIPSLRTVPFRVPLIAQTSGGSGYWTGEGKPMPLTKFDFSRITLEPLKVGNIAVATMETLRDSSPSAEALIRDSLAGALRERMDIDFIDPNKAASSGISPASILNGLVAIASSGTDADAVRADIKALLSVFIAANNAPTNGVLLMSSVMALSLSIMRNPLGQKEFPDINMNGGMLEGMPVITSEYVPTNSNGSIVAMVNASDIYFADNGDVSVDMSDQASLQMLDNPTNDSVTPTATTSVSLWQTDSVGFRASRTVNWARRRVGSAAYLSGVNWA